MSESYISTGNFTFRLRHRLHAILVPFEALCGPFHLINNNTIIISTLASYGT